MIYEFEICEYASAESTTAEPREPAIDGDAGVSTLRL